eukprot:TRINITY_DN1121_c0_g1_i1.p1 TRINITY_DN1121_c0_g1~~TRINITY_DN1121_c0_g1_i1.p1  ORF type:complete len:379 (+),score=158.08 TRINITY_DN1121_c0_g1_i1:33-1169(+)
MTTSQFDPQFLYESIEESNLLQKAKYLALQAENCFRQNNWLQASQKHKLAADYFKQVSETTQNLEIKKQLNVFVENHLSKHALALQILDANKIPENNNENNNNNSNYVNDSNSNYTNLNEISKQNDWLNTKLPTDSMLYGSEAELVKFRIEALAISNVDENDENEQNKWWTDATTGFWFGFERLMDLLPQYNNSNHNSGGNSNNSSSNSSNNSSISNFSNSEIEKLKPSLSKENNELDDDSFVILDFDSQKKKCLKIIESLEQDNNQLKVKVKTLTDENQHLKQMLQQYQYLSEENKAMKKSIQLFRDEVQKRTSVYKSTTLTEDPRLLAASAAGYNNSTNIDLNTQNLLKKIQTLEKYKLRWENLKEAAKRKAKERN